MKTLKSPEPSVNSDNPFEDCKLDRKKYADNLTRIIENYPSGFVMALNNRWGDGKTFFVNRWRQKLKNEGFQVVYYNAWEDDYSENALVSILSEIKDDIVPKSDAQFNKLLKSSTNFIAKAVPIVIKSGVKLVSGIPGTDEIFEIIGSNYGKKMSDLVDQHIKQKESVKGFKKSLTDFANKKGEGKPIVFFIDELDRCKPTYTVEVLEIIKHLFSVENIVFVLSVDKEQLANSVKGYYGSDQIDGHEYLRRFIDFEFSLPTQSNKNLFLHFYNLFNFSSFFDRRKAVVSGGYRLQDDFDYLVPYCELLIEHQKLSGRQIEKFMSTLRIILIGVSIHSPILSTLSGFLVFVKLFRPIDFDKIVNKELNFEELLTLNKEVSYPKKIDIDNELYPTLGFQEFYIFNTYFKYCFKDINSPNIINEFNKVKTSSMFPEEVTKYLNMNRMELPEKEFNLSFLLDFLNFNKTF